MLQSMSGLYQLIPWKSGTAQMDLRVMAAVTAAISAERLARSGERIARATGAVAIGAGLSLTARAAGLL